MNTTLLLAAISVALLAWWGIANHIQELMEKRREAGLQRLYLQTNIHQLVLAMCEEESAAGHEMLRRAMAHTLVEYRAL